MAEHTVKIDGKTNPTTIEFSPVFNVAMPFIDRHVEEERTESVAIRTTGGLAVTYGELVENVNRCGNLLRDRAIEPGERLLMIVKDCPEFMYLFWGAIKAGIVPVPLNTLLKSHDYRYMIEDSECAALAYSPEFRGEVEPALSTAALAPDRVMLTGDRGISSLLPGMSKELSPLPTEADDDCFWLYSSGSTGTPKGAVHSHKSMVITSQYYGVETLGFSADDISFSAAKLFFAYGLGNAMTFPLWVGGQAILLDGRPTPANTFEIIENLQPTLFFGVPTLFAAQLQVLEQREFDLSSLRLCVSAGEALPAEILKRWKAKTDLDILDGIGSTEALHIFVSNRVDDILPGTSGRPVPGYDAVVVDGNGQEVATGETGRLRIRGLSTTKRYWNNPDKTTAAIVDGWLDTGDTYFKDDNGYFHYCGRNDDMLKVGGIWCSPFEIEARLVEHETVLEAAVVARADRDDLVKPEAFVVLKDGREGSNELAAQLMAHCKEGLAPYKFPRWLNFVEALPKTATGKIQRFKLRQSTLN